jgi:hypothetical protein
MNGIVATGVSPYAMDVTANTGRQINFDTNSETNQNIKIDCGTVIGSITAQ